ncbi:hypothetical protein INT47_003765 [Mucor saturninus]|uniref:F-box domain-containing protein n=1 Tax=Mucor saturninus TaxID=64648 RepID=A0A8H7RAL9_9FUNG|nr:hypothetical protein INT47_003765 [Mucor saturninus]
MSTTTLWDLPREVMYMILDNLSLEDRTTCRLVNSDFLKVASYVFREITLASKENINFFADCLDKTPCIAPHVQKINVDTAILLRFANRTCIKTRCHHVKEIQILISQGNSLWAEQLKPYRYLQHVPTFIDSVNAQYIMDNYKNQLMTVRLGGKYLLDLSIQDIKAILNELPQIKLVGLHYTFSEKKKNVHKDLPRTFSFNELNSILKQSTVMTGFELQFCEIADASLLAVDVGNVDALQSLRHSLVVRPSYQISVFDTNHTLTHIDMKSVMVTNVTHFMRSMFDSFPNLRSLDIKFVPRDMPLQTLVGSQWDMPQPNIWSKEFVFGTSGLRKLALTDTQSRLNISELLSALVRAKAPLNDISITGSEDQETGSMDVICSGFKNTLEKLRMDCKASFGLDNVGLLIHLKTAVFRWGRSHTSLPMCPADIINDMPTVTKLDLGYNRWYTHMISRPTAFAYKAYTNITSITLTRVIINENETKEFLLPLIHLKEAIFSYCMFEKCRDNELEEPNYDVDYTTSALGREEVFDFMTTTGELMNEVRRNMFKEGLGMIQANTVNSLEPIIDTDEEVVSSCDTLAAVLDSVARTMADIGQRHGLQSGQRGESPAPPVETSAAPPIPEGYLEHLLDRARGIIQLGNRLRPVNDPFKSKRNDLHIQSLSLEHLGLHECKIREMIGGISNARTIRNFEVVQDRRSGCAKSYDKDRAYHEKKSCNPHVVLNKKTVTDKTIGFHYTHEFGGKTGKNDYVNSRPTFKIRLFSLEKLSIRPNCLMSIYFTDKNGGKLKTCNSVVNDIVEEAKANNGEIPPMTIVPDMSSVEDDRIYAKELMEAFKSNIKTEEVGAEVSISSSVKRQNEEVEEVSRFLGRALDPGRRPPDDFLGARTRAFYDTIRGIRNIFDDEEETDDDTVMGNETNVFNAVSRFDRMLAEVGRAEDIARASPDNIQDHLDQLRDSLASPAESSETTTVQPFVLNKNVFDADIFKSVVYDTCEFSRNRRHETPKSGKNRKTMAIRPF